VTLCIDQSIDVMYDTHHSSTPTTSITAAPNNTAYHLTNTTVVITNSSCGTNGEIDNTV
jgi:hypothetical protein